MYAYGKARTVDPREVWAEGPWSYSFTLIRTIYNIYSAQKVAHGIWKVNPKLISRGATVLQL